jgi:hypothetical protein
MMGIQKTGKATLQKSKKDTLSLERISKPSDLLKCKTIASQIIKVGVEHVLIEIRLSVQKCAMALNISMSDNQVVTLCEDLMDTYTYDSIEDVRECLKDGRQGKYGFGHNSRNSLNMVLITEWMSFHLEKKEIERRKADKNSYTTSKKELPKVDYKAYQIRMEKEDREKHKEKQGSEEYNDFKLKYLSDRTKP